MTGSPSRAGGAPDAPGSSRHRERLGACELREDAARVADLVRIFALDNVTLAELDWDEKVHGTRDPACGTALSAALDANYDVSLVQATYTADITYTPKLDDSSSEGAQVDVAALQSLEPKLGVNNASVDQASRQIKAKSLVLGVCRAHFDAVQAEQH